MGYSKNKLKLFTSKYLHENYKVNKYLKTKIKKKIKFELYY